MFASLFAGGIKGVLSGAKDLISEFHMSPADKVKLQIKLLEAEAAVDKAQIAVNLKEAEHPNWFVSGWRPFVGWTCGVGLGYQVLLQPILAWAAVLAHLPIPPLMDTSLLTTVLLGMLGLGGIRAYEKMKGVSRN